MDPRTFHRATAWLMAGLLVFLAYRIIQPFFTPLAWATIIAIFSYPLHRRVLRLARRPNLAALLTTLIITVLLVLPVVLIVPVLVREGMALFDWLRSKDGLAQVRLVLDNVMARVPADLGNVQETIEDLSRTAGTYLAQQSARIAGNVVSFVFQLAVMLLALFFLLREGPQLVRWLADLSPLGSGHEVVVHEATELVQATITSGFIVAVVQGALGGLVLWILNVPSALFYGVLMAFLAFLPLIGPWIVWGPIAIVLLLTGHTGRGIALLVLGFLLVSGVDNILRPVLIAGRSQLNGLLVFISVLGGIHAFGLVGVVLGPLVVATGVGLLKGYRKELQMMAAADRPAAAP
jgi:predicted PurR-regulated permease PerM